MVAQVKLRTVPPAGKSSPYNDSSSFGSTSYREETANGKQHTPQIFQGSTDHTPWIFVIFKIYHTPQKLSVIVYINKFKLFIL